MAVSINLKSFRNFIRSGAIGGILLIACVIISLAIANSHWGEDFAQLLSTPLGLENGWIELKYSLLSWINDGLMAIFFLLIGLEIKRELVEGELSSVKQAILPVFAAVGGAILPAVIFFLFNRNDTGKSGWGIPMATDIAFALSVITLLGKRVPASLKIFLAALAIVDDLIAILVIALFYSSDVHLSYLFYSIALLLLLFVFNRLGVKSLIVYLIPGILIWYCVHHSGIHATIAGVLTASAIPTNESSEASPLEKLEHLLTKPVNFIIMPIFALANTNIDFSSASATMLTGNLGAGILFGLLLGKPVGIFLLSRLTVKMGWGVLPHHVTWSHIMGTGLLGGIGFTMSIFIALLSFSDTSMQTASKFSILVASTIAGISGYLFLLITSRKKPLSSY